MIATNSQLSELKIEIKTRFRDIEILMTLLREKEESKQPEDINIIPCLSAIVLLGLYNILEYLLCECINHICDQINSSNTTYFFLKPAIQKALFSQARKNGQKEKMEYLFHHERCQFVPERDQIVNGNIGYANFTSILKNFCIIEENKELPSNRSGINLDTLKDIRNNISHGNTGLYSVRYSYSDVEKFFEYG